MSSKNKGKKTIVMVQDDSDKKQIHLPELVDEIDGLKVIKPENFIKLIENDLFDIDPENLKPDDFGNEKILVVKKSTYTDAHRRAQQRYREKYPEKYYQQQKKVYDNHKEDPEWKDKFNTRSKVNNAKYRDKKKQEKINSGVVVRGRGRPRKTIIE